MFIKSIVLDGFKSYAQRTEISGFDSLFNAITGLNGSGKSNILDSICFVLGISNLHHVRATNLQELVYKNGQAGITKATVSITFDNSDPDQCPFGYSQYDEIVVTRQVVVGGRNKYMINGTAASNQKVADLFKSVSLNINNPHFLIMQGRITKVLNMKPPEILSMIEEAAGTRLYESKRENAEKMIEKKESKLREIDQMIEEDTGPKLARLKKERDSYIEYQKIVREIEHLNKLYVAWQFMCAEKEKTSSVSGLASLEEKVEDLQAKCADITNLVKDLDMEIEDLEQQIQGNQADTLVQLEKDLHEKQQADAVACSNYDESVKEIKSQRKKMKELIKNRNDDSSVLEKKRVELNENSKANADNVKKREQAKEAFAAAQKKFQTESAGLASNDDGEDATLNDQLLAAKNEISQAETDIKNAQLKIKHSQQEVVKRKSQVKTASADYERDQKTLSNINQQANQIQQKRDNLSYEEDSLESLKERKSNITSEMEKLKHKYDVMSEKFPSLQFDYVDPVKGFDRRKVRGPVARLVQVKDPSSATALEVVAGGRLYNIVVDDDKTAQQLLDKGRLKRKYTILPLNKLTAKPLDSKTVSYAKSLVGKENVSLALELVGYDSEIQAAITHVFGNTLVCKDSEAAQKVTFDKKIWKKSVTLEGDSYDPSGTLTGGSQAQSSRLLSKLSEINEVLQQITVKEQQLNQLSTELADLAKKHQQYVKCSEQLSIKMREAEMLSSKLKQTAHGAQLEHIKDLEETITQQNQVVEGSKQKIQSNKARVVDLQHRIKNAKQMREERLKTLEKELSSTKKELEKIDKKFSQQEQESETLKLEVETLEKEVENYQNQIEQLEEAIKDAETKSDELKAVYMETKSVVEDITHALKSHKEEIAERNKLITNKVTEQKKLKQQYTEMTLQIEQLAHDIDSTKASGKSAAKQLENLLQKHEWIGEEKQYFGQPNSAYDFSVNDPKGISKQITRLQDKRHGLERTVNMRAMTMLDQAQAQHNDMLRKRRILIQDKEKIAVIIAELNEKKNIAVEKAYKQVNKDFTSIFSMLLPGATARLSPPDGANCLDGLEVRVGFGDVWKESLTELSGGQRSLVALSLILAMLLFKPAPLYILDEVDAALDLSHTQNIGHMLKTHFRHSQFIVVSLKDGMFTNANVLFRTRFVDGVSTVTRHTQNTQRKPSDKKAGKQKSSKGLSETAATTV